MSRNSGKTQRVARHSRVRNKVSGTAERPRLAVFRSLKNIYAQIIDDQSGNTIVSASSLEDKVKDKNIADSSGKLNISVAVGKVVAERAKVKGHNALLLYFPVFSLQLDAHSALQVQSPA